MSRNYTPPLDVLQETTSELDRELEHIRSLEQTIGTLAFTRMVDIGLDFENDRVPVNRAIERVMCYEYPAPSTFCYDPVFKRLDGTSLKNFTPRSSRGGKNSKNGVVFGDLGFDNGFWLPVAVKPHEADSAEQAAKLCLKDYFNGVAVGHVGIRSLQPAGYLIDGKKKAYSMTRLEESLTTLDSIDWSTFYPNVDENPGMQQIWTQVARQLATFHSSGANSHLDVAGRNIAVTAENRAFLIDWEKSFISPQQPSEADVRYQFSHPDLASLAETMCYPPNGKYKVGLGIFYGKDGDWWQGFKDIVLDEYIEERKNPDNYPSDVPYGEILGELEVLQASLHQDINAIQENSHNIPVI